MCTNSSNQLDEITNQILNHHKEEKMKKIKLQMNQHEIFL